MLRVLLFDKRYNFRKYSQIGMNFRQKVYLMYNQTKQVVYLLLTLLIFKYNERKAFQKECRQPQYNAEMPRQLSTIS